MITPVTLPADVMRISKPGAYMMSPEAYYGDPAPSPSLTQSIAKILLEQSPAHAFLAHPRLSPDAPLWSQRRLELGTVAHAMLIGRGKDVVVIGAPTYQTKVAKEERDNALLAGKTPILVDDYETAVAMVVAARKQLGMIEGCERTFTDGHGELVLAWREGDIWLRTQIDWVDPVEMVVTDYKTTATSAAPHQLAKSIPNKALDVQAAMFERGLGNLNPESYGRWRFRFVLQETDPPYALSVIELDGAAMTMGQKKIGFAVDLWRRCVEADYWPAYPLAIVRPEYPGYAEDVWLKREVAFADIAGTPLDPFHAIMGAATPLRTGMLTEFGA